MKKKFISLLTALSMTIMFINITAAAEGGCDGTHSGMSAWTDENDLPASGNYYLDTDVNLSSSISIRGSLTLCLNGHTITAASGEQIFAISDSLTLCDCSSGKTGKLIGGGNVSFTGGAVDVTGGTFTMNGGTISGNTAGTGGGVFVRSGASFIMNGGTISNNITNSSGGGVYSSGIFTMNGGTISDNTTNSNAGGGVFVSSSGTFIMNGGMISSNTADIRGGGVYVNGGTFTMSGGIISGNTTAERGGGVCINGTFEINGKVNISGNTKTDGSDNNVYLFTGKKISIGNDFNTSSTIGVNTEAEFANCKSYADVTGAATSDISDSFKADIDGQNIVYEDGKVQLKGEHDWGEWEITAEPSETDKGEATRSCTITEEHTDTKELPALNDTTVWTKDDTKHVEPTEEDTGKDVYTSEYGEIEVELPVKEHTHVWSDTYEKDDNQHWKVCKKCNEAGTKENHTWNDGTVTIQPTEENEGEKTYTCTVCSKTKTDSIEKLEHTHDWSGAYQFDDSQHWKVCAKCNEAGTKENHAWNDGTVTKEPTEEAAGEKTYTCTVCSATKTESIDKLVHTHTYYNEWSKDETSHWHAANCGHDVISGQAAHTEDNGTVTISPTAENDGLKTYACSVCGYVIRTVTIPKLGEDHNHSFSTDWKHDSANHWQECDCGEKNGIAPHVENDGVVTTEPTETSTGTKTYSCSVCGYVIRTDIIPAVIPEHTHTFGADWRYDALEHWHECECGEKNNIANHISSDWIVVTPATTDLEGVQIKRCTFCGIELDRAVIEKLPNTNTGDVAEDVQDTAGTNAGLVQDNTLIENVLTPEDKTEVENGSSFEIVLEVTDIRDSVSAADVTAVSSALKSDEKIGMYVDLSLFKIKDGTVRTQITDANDDIGITLTIPDTIYAPDRTYSIIRVHNGTAQNLGGTYDRANRRLTFYTDKFSTYAIAYTASNGGTGTPSEPSKPTIPSPPSGGTTPVPPSAPIVTPTVTETVTKTEDEVISDEPYVEDVSSAAGIYETDDNSQSPLCMIVIIIAIAVVGFSSIIIAKHFAKKKH